MKRIYNGRELELLAPAGTPAILESLLDSGADAFYLGGKGLNMRLHRRDFNFSDDELVKAGELCRSRGLKLYVTVNKLMGDDDLAAAPGYLEFLARDVRPDALIVQDLAVPSIVKERGLPLALHASVMMNAHDEAGVRALAGMGFSRVVLSRESSFDDLKRIRDATGMEMEYFAHGDLCAAHGSQCLYSGMLFGLSSNRGMCMKPCRWPFAVAEGGSIAGAGFPLAVRDMCLYRDLEAAARAGVSSFKIEGRMRGGEYLKRIVAAYSGALDRLVAGHAVAEHAVAESDTATATFTAAPLDADDPGSACDAVYDELFANRMRDFTPAFAYGNPGAAILNARWEGTGKFYSTGKVFSHAIPEPEAAPEDARCIEAVLRKTYTASCAASGTASSARPGRPELAVRVDTATLADAALESGADAVILSGEPFVRVAGAIASKPELETLRARHPGKTVCLSLPRMIGEGDYAFWERALAERAGLFDELYITQLGADDRFRPYAPRLAGDAPLNALNARAAAVWAERGLSSVCASPEAGAADFAALVAGSPLLVEAIVHGRPTAMYIGLDMEACLGAIRGSSAVAVPGDADAAVRRAGAFGDGVSSVLVDACGSPHPIARDIRGAYHFLPTKAISLYSLTPALAEIGVARLRIEGALYGEAHIRALCAAYRSIIDGADPAAVPMPPEIEGSWFGALRTGFSAEHVSAMDSPASGGHSAATSS